MSRLSQSWSIDPRLEADTRYLWSFGDFQFRMMTADKRWPWIILVPMVVGAEDLDDLSFPQIEALLGVASDVSRTLKAMGSASTNVATLGNVVAQFHLHVVGRTDGDPGWPGPVWGHGEAVPFTAGEADAFATAFSQAWTETVPLLRRV